MYKIPYTSILSNVQYLLEVSQEYKTVNILRRLSHHEVNCSIIIPILIISRILVKRFMFVAQVIKEKSNEKKRKRRYNVMYKKIRIC